MADKKNIWTEAFEDEAELRGKEKTEKYKKFARENRYTGPRTNDISEYNPKRRAIITKVRNLGLTSEADMEGAANIKKAARRAAYAASKKGLKAVPVIGTALSLLDADELGASERMSDELKSELNQMEEYKKGGIVGRGQGRAIRIKTTKQY